MKYVHDIDLRHMEKKRTISSPGNEMGHQMKNNKSKTKQNTWLDKISLHKK